MASNSPRYFFAVLIGLSAGYLAGFLTAVQMHPSSSDAPERLESGKPAVSSQSSANQSGLPEGHPPIDYQKEIEALQQILKNNPEDFNALAQMGNAYYDMGRFADAVDWYGKALKIHPDDPNTRTDLATAYHYLGQHERAVRELELVLSKTANFAHALYNLGIVKQVGMQDAKGAIDAWERLLATNPEYSQADQVRENIAKLKSGKPL